MSKPGAREGGREGGREGMMLTTGLRKGRKEGGREGGREEDIICSLIIYIPMHFFSGCLLFLPLSGAMLRALPMGAIAGCC